MSIAVTCQACGSEFKVKEEHAGKRFACRTCRAPLTVPQAAAVQRTALHTSATQPLVAQPEALPSAPAGKVVAACDTCGNRVAVGAELVGRRVRCHKCGQVFRIPAAANPDLMAFAASAPRPVRAAASPLAPKPAPAPPTPHAFPAARHAAPATTTAPAPAPLMSDEPFELEIVEDSPALALAPARPFPPLASTALQSSFDDDALPPRRQSSSSNTAVRVVAILAAVGVAATVVVIAFVAALRSDKVRGWARETATRANVAQGTPGGTQLIELQRQIVEADQELAAIMEGVTDATTARAASPRFADCVQRSVALTERGQQMGLQQMSMAQKNQLDELQGQDRAAAARMEVALVRLATIPGAMEALYTDYLARGGRPESQRFGNMLGHNIPQPGAPPDAPRELNRPRVPAPRFPRPRF